MVKWFIISDTLLLLAQRCKEKQKTLIAPRRQDAKKIKTEKTKIYPQRIIFIASSSGIQGLPWFGFLCALASLRETGFPDVNLIALQGR